MNDHALAYTAGFAAARREILSALPDAPTVVQRVAVRGRYRSTLAMWLRTAADRIAPKTLAQRPTREATTAC